MIIRTELESFRTPKEMLSLFNSVIYDRTIYPDEKFYRREGILKAVFEEYGPLVTLVQNLKNAVSARLMPYSNKGHDAEIRLNLKGDIIILTVQITLAHETYKNAFSRKHLSQYGFTYPTGNKAHDKTGKVFELGRALCNPCNLQQEQVVKIISAIKKQV